MILIHSSQNRHKMSTLIHFASFVAPIRVTKIPLDRWQQKVGEKLYCHKDNILKEQKRPSIGVYRKNKKNVEQLLGHVPMELEQLLIHFLNKYGCGLSVKVIGDRYRDKKGSEMGLVVPGEWQATSPSIENIKRLITRIKENPNSLVIENVSSGAFNIEKKIKKMK